MLKTLNYVCAAAAAFIVHTHAYAGIYVIPSGECIGVKMYTDGLIVVGTTAVTDTAGRNVSPTDKSGIKKGDIVTAVNGTAAVSNEMLSEAVASAAGTVTLTVESDGKKREVTLTPAETDSGPKLGLWLRDSTAGLGTLTYTDGSHFAALGHAICDVDTGNIMPIERGIIQNCTITSVKKGDAGSPGAVTGDIDGAELGSITDNTELGIFGELENEPEGEPVEVASASEVRTGEATILADVDGKGVTEYTIDIKRVTPPSSSGKDLVIEVTDPELIEKTGGIVQGMSGAPILQNGKLAGAVTHVFVNDPLSGYGVLAESMVNCE